MTLIFESCQNEDRPVIKSQVNFSIASTGSSNGRVQSTSIPSAVVVSVHDASGKTILEHVEIKLTVFGGGYISTPISIDSESQQKFYLSEFLVLSDNDSVLYASPREGSDLAHLVNDPLDIEFNITPGQITTVTPEVIAVDNELPASFGYAEFGFRVVKKIEAVFSVFIAGDGGYELTDAHVKFEGLQDSTSTSPNVLWTYETDLAATNNIIALRESPVYRITVTRDGYQTWQETMGLKASASVSIFLKVLSVMDVYTFGGTGINDEISGLRSYYKNGVRVFVNSGFHPSGLYAQNNDIYLAGVQDGITNAFYMKNNERIDLPFEGRTTDVFFAGDDLYVMGFYKTSNPAITLPFYLKNSERFDMPALTPGNNARITSMAVEGNDVYFSGYQFLTNNDAIPLVWKNGQAASLPTGSSTHTYTSEIKVKNGHVYVSGKWFLSTQKRAVYWTDGELTYLSDGSSDDGGMGIDVTDSGDVYVCGLWNYWKNGEKVLVPGTSVNLYDLSVVDNKVYLTGSVYVPTSTGRQLVAANWIDGVPSHFPLTAIFCHMQVVNH